MARLAKPQPAKFTDRLNWFNWLMIAWGWGTVIFLVVITLAILSGCSAKARIGQAAHEVTKRAVSATTHIDTAIGTGDVGAKALPHLDDAKEDLSVIEEQAAAVTDALPGVKDVDGWLTRLMKSLGFWLVLIAAVVLSVFYAPVIRPVLLHVGAWINFIPKPVRVDAQTDAAWAASGKPDNDAARSIELKKATDPRYKRAFDEALTRLAAAPAGGKP